VVYLFETKIDENLPAVKGLSKVYGLGRNQSESILSSLGLQNNIPFGSITKAEIARIKKLVEKDFFVATRLRQEKNASIQSLIKVRSYRGSRHKNRLPVRGQRTSTNARTQKKKEVVIVRHLIFF
jgi:small subunit ribosomal protein S13